MMLASQSFGFPFAVDQQGRISASGGDDALRGQIIQILFTAPGERINLPEFGCGLFSLVFEPGDLVLVAAMEFTVGQAIARWLGDLIVVDQVHITREQELVTIEIAYTRRVNLSRQAVRIQFR